MINVKISAAAQDNSYKKAIEEQLQPLVAQQQIELLGEQGASPFEHFDEGRQEVDLLVILLSKHYLKQPQLEKQDVLPLLRNRQKNPKQYWLLPILLDESDYSKKAYASFPAFPRPQGGTSPLPIQHEQWPNELEALLQAAAGIRQGIQYLSKGKAQPKAEKDRLDKVLLLTSNPKDTARLNLNLEINSIIDVHKRSLQRQQFDIELSLDVEKEELLETLVQVKPRIIHFSGHGTGQNGLLFYGKNGKAEEASGEGLGNIFRLFADTVECVLLNACHSQAQAEVIAQYIPYVIGTDNTITDDKAISFSEGFYTGIFNGEPIDKAFEIAVAHVGFQDLPTSAQAILYKNGKAAQGPGALELAKEAGTTPHSGKKQDLPIEEPQAPPSQWIDFRDQQVYPLVKIGKQVWMARNFNFEQAGSLATAQPKTLGRFYTWEQAQQACPEGWRLPSRADWQILLENLGGDIKAGKALKSTSGWKSGSAGDNSSGFNALPAGEYDENRKEFWNQGYYAHFWSANDRSGEIYNGEKLAYRYRLSYNTQQVLESATYKSEFFTVRYVRTD